MSRPSVRLRGLVPAALFLALAAAFLYQQLSLPSDGARLEPAESVWRPNGVVVTPLEGGKTPLLPGDVVVAVEGRSLEEWAQGIFQPGFLRAALPAGRPLAYTVLRAGRPIDLAIAPLPYPLAAILARSWSTILFTFLTQLVLTVVFVLRPNDRPARTLFIWAFSLSHTYAWALGLQVADLVNGLGYWLYQVSASGAWLIFWSAGLEFAMVFPRIHPLLQRRPGLVRLNYASSFLIFLVFLVLSRILSPTTVAWLGSWIVGTWFVAAIFQILTAYFIFDGYRSTPDLAARKKVRWLVLAFVLCGGIGLGLWFLPGIVLGRPSIDANILGLSLLPFPFILAIAVVHDQLFDIDIILRRTLVYVPLTALLAGLYAASVALLQRLFIAVTGQGSDLAAVLGTLVVVAALTPIKDRLQKAVDARFKYANDPAVRLKAFEEQLRTRFSSIDPIQVTRRLSEEAAEAFDAKGSAVFWGGEERPSFTFGEWDGEIQLSTAVASRERKYGVVALGARRNRQIYDEHDRAILEQAASFVARVVEQDSLANSAPAHGRPGSSSSTGIE